MDDQVDAVVRRLGIDPDGTVPPYEQLRTKIAQLAASGELVAGQKLPTVRHLAEALGLAANTVARAYRELEADGVISTQGRRGTFVASRALDGSDASIDDVRRGAVDFTELARRHGLSLAEATRLVADTWPRSPDGPREPKGPAR
jgi:DNA-binding transcriptional regulator YhcF (GntR family)